MSEVTIEPLTGPYGLGEGPHWDSTSQKLYFVDIFAQKIFKFDPATGGLTFTFIGTMGFEKNGVFPPNLGSLYSLVWAYNYNSETGTISNKKIVFDLQKNDISGIPDGMTIDTNGNLWVAVYSGGSVLNINPQTGELLRSIKFNDAKNITSVAFGGPNLDILYVTSASMGLDENQLKEQPHAGYLFAVKGLGARGFPSNNAKLKNDIKLLHKLT
ncbi:hypothetical protein QLX08_007876 [Tetragonisca angustula]|uniref:SMP-30/Gluconolactonase/LRE-like region domain-containing protein n=1 Tax=Tetragonisca angustula TaxID=166442 RepID=A0AAW0ZMU8_9HYME